MWYMKDYLKVFFQKQNHDEDYVVYFIKGGLGSQTVQSNGLQITMSVTN